MNRLRLKTLKPRIPTLDVAPCGTTTNKRQSGSAAVRWTGRKLQRWRERILSAEPLCRHCSEHGRVTLAQEVDHIVPLELGGEYTNDNAQPLCGPCHIKKTAKDRGYAERTTFDASGRVVW